MADVLQRAILALCELEVQGQEQLKQHAGQVVDLMLRLLHLWQMVGATDIASVWLSGLFSQLDSNRFSERGAGRQELSQSTAQAAQFALACFLRQRPEKTILLCLCFAQMMATGNLPTDVVHRYGARNGIFGHL